MAKPDHYYHSYLITIYCVVVLLTAQIRGSDDEASLLGGKKLIIGVPKKVTFIQFVDTQLNPLNNTQLVNVTGYSIDVFLATIAYLQRSNYNISFEFCASVDNNGNTTWGYDGLVYQVHQGKYDAAVADLTIVANRSNFVDFTLPYAQSDVRMLVKVRHGAVILFMERNVNNKEDSTLKKSPIKKQFSGISILWFPIVQAVFPERESLAKNCSSTSAPISLPYLKVDRSRLKDYVGIKQYKEALDKGSRNGGVDAIFDEVPYIKVFLKECGSNYAMVGPRHRTGGFGFAFSKNSTLTSHFSQAILNVTESNEMNEIEERYFKGHEDEDGISTPTTLDDDSDSLTTYSFAGLFVVFGILSLLALLVSEHRIWRRQFMLMNMSSKKFLRCRSSPVTNMSEQGSTTRRRNVDDDDDDGEGSRSRENIGSGRHAEYNHVRILVASLP
ncbi:hypothetical protein K1719_011491 [Acacia pycnantha]|nr:hypothetical protein K1719_011491 [Acacia pycnantha]